MLEFFELLFSFFGDLILLFWRVPITPYLSFGQLLSIVIILVITLSLIIRKRG